jgi:gluconokinase
VAHSDTLGSDRSGAEPPLALGVDMGTSSVRAFVYDRWGRNLGGARARYAWTATPDGGVEVDADALVGWTANAVDGALQEVGELASEIVGVGVSAFWHGLVGVGADGSAVTPVYAWSDTRARVAAADLRRELDETAVHARTGAVFHPSYLPARLLWLRRKRPEAFRRVRCWMSPGEYLELKLFGERRASLSMASATGLLDQSALAWDEVLVDALPLTTDQLSPLVDLDSPFRGLRPEWAARWPALRSLPWLPAVGDGACANVGSGCVASDCAALSLGTSGALRVLSREERVEIPRGLWRFRLDRERVLLGGAISNGGSVYRWLRETLRLPPAEELEAILLARPPGAHGIALLPFLAGERSPDWPLSARAAMAGFTMATTPVDIAQAALEAVAYRLALVHHRLRQSFPDVARVVASGGALRASPAWARIIADVLGDPLEISAVREPSSRGAALLALEVLGIVRDAADAPTPPGETINPDPEWHAWHRRALGRHEDLDARLASWEAPPPPSLQAGRHLDSQKSSSWRNDEDTAQI